jgi:type II secretory pathway predicted ATPase ExeA
MYEGFYGLGGRPFDLTPDPRFLLLTPKHREALTLVEYVLAGRAGLGLLLGEAGTGKTTLLRAARERSGRAGDCVVTLDNPTLDRDEFFEFLADGFRLGQDAGRSKARVLRELTRSLEERHLKGGVSALVFDEAQSLSSELLEEIRLLANVETGSTKLLCILLAGQPELAHRLNEPGLRQLKQRVALRGTLEPLTWPETVDYIAGRLGIVGGDVTRTFTRAAVQAVFEHAGGIPRTISVICENALITGFAAAARPIDQDIVMEVCRDLDLAPVPGELLATGQGAGSPPVADPPALPEAPKTASAAPASGPAAAPTPEAEEEAASPPRGATDRPANGDPRRSRRAFDLWPFRRRRSTESARLHIQYFDTAGERGFLLTPAAGKGPGEDR